MLGGTEGTKEWLEEDTSGKVMKQLNIEDEGKERMMV